MPPAYTQTCCVTSSLSKYTVHLVNLESKCIVVIYGFIRAQRNKRWFHLILRGLLSSWQKELDASFVKVHKKYKSRQQGTFLLLWLDIKMHHDQVSK